MKQLLLLLLLVASSTGWGQNKRLSQKEVEAERLFVEAGIAKMSGDTEKAIKLYKEGLTQDRNNAGICYELARLHFVKGDDISALNYAKTASSSEPDNAWFALLLGDISKKAGQPKEAALAYEKAAKIEPSNEDYGLLWAKTLEENNDWQGAIKALEWQQQVNGKTENNSRLKQTIFLKNNQPDLAIQELQSLCNTFPKNTEYLHYLASLQLQLGKKEDAKQTFQKILSLNPSDSKANVALLADKKSGNATDYLSSLKPIFENPEIKLDAKIKELIPYVVELAEKRDMTKSPQLLELVDILENQHKDAKIFAIKGDILYHSDRKKEALQYYEQALELNKNVYTVWEQVLSLCFESNKFEKLCLKSEEVLDFFPNQPSVYLYQGHCQRNKKDLTAAQTAYNKAFRMSLKNPLLRSESAFYLSEVYIKQDKLQDAQKLITTMKDTEKIEDCFVMEAMGDLAAAQKQASDAQKWWQKALTAGGNKARIQAKIEGKAE